MNRPRNFLLLVILAAAFVSAPVYAQEGGALFKTYCAICHEEGGNLKAPSRDALSRMAPEQILQALENGTMKAQAAERSRAQRHVLAEYLSGKTLASAPAIVPASAFCGTTAAPFRAVLTGPSWNGWGAGLTNTRFQPGDAAGMSARDVSRLKLKWAFGLPGASSGGTQPVVAGGRIYVGDAEGDLFALDAKSGCVSWHIESRAGSEARSRSASGAAAG